MGDHSSAFPREVSQFTATQGTHVNIFNLKEAFVMELYNRFLIVVWHF